MPDRDEPPLLQAAEMIVAAFCVGEAFSVPVLRGTWHAARHPLLKGVLGIIVRDEAAHGAFGWTFLDWAGDALAPYRDRLALIARLAIEEFTADHRRSRGCPTPTSAATAGWSPRPTSRSAAGRWPSTSFARCSAAGSIRMPRRSRPGSAASGRYPADNCGAPRDDDIMMNIGLTRDQIVVALGAAKAVATADGRFEEHERELLAAACKALGHPGPIDDVSVPEPRIVAEALPDRPSRERLVQAMLLVAMMDGEVQASELAVVRRYADALDVDEPAVKDLARVACGHTTVVKYDLLRRSGMVQTAARAAFEKKGLKGLWSMVGSLYGLEVDPDLAWRYKRLGLLPEGSFGREYWAHMTERGFSFPGEHKGFPRSWRSTTSRTCSAATTPIQPASAR